MDKQKAQLEEKSIDIASKLISVLVANRNGDISVNEVAKAMRSIGCSDELIMEAIKRNMTKVGDDKPQKVEVKGLKLSEEIKEFTTFWNDELCPPLVSIGKFNPKRRTAFRAIRRDYSLEDMFLVARSMAEDEFYQKKFKASVDTFLRTTKFDEKFEKAKDIESETKVSKADLEKLDGLVGDYFG